MMTEEQHKKLQDLYALCGVCAYQHNCNILSNHGKCPNVTGEYEIFKLPEGFINFDHYATKVATEEIYKHLKEIRKLVMLIHPEDPYLAMFVSTKDDSTRPGTIRFNNAYWELPAEKKINFDELKDVEVSE